MPLCYRQNIPYPPMPKRDDKMVRRSPAGTKYRAPDDRGTPWSEEDTKILREFFGKITTDELKAKLGRTAGSINHRASRLGLRKT